MSNNTSKSQAQATAKPEWSKLSLDSREDLVELEWARTYMRKTSNPSVLEHTDPFGLVYQIERMPDYTWTLHAPSGDTFQFPRRKDCVRAISSVTAQALFELGLEVGKWTKPAEVIVTETQPE